MKNYFGNTLSVSNSWDPDQARRNVGPDLSPNCLQMLSADDTSKQSVINNSSLLLASGIIVLVKQLLLYLK